MNSKKEMFAAIINENPIGYILRRDLKKKTHGLLIPSVEAAKDHYGKGIQNRIKIGKLVAYPVHELVSYLQAKVVFLDENAAI